MTVTVIGIGLHPLSEDIAKPPPSCCAPCLQFSRLSYQCQEKPSVRTGGFLKICLTFCHAICLINVLQKVGDDLSPRTGRPKVEKPKSVNYSVRLDLETEQRLREYCREHGMTRGEAIRQGIHLLLEERK